MKKQIIIIGAGAAGLMAGITAAGNGADVIILEKYQKPGKKILITGNGRCNLTNTHQESSFYRSSDPKAAYRVIERFNAFDTIRYFTSIGIFTKNRDGWIYPSSDQASSVLTVLKMEAAYKKVKIKTNEEVQEVKKEKNTFYVKTNTYTYTADSVIVACGSCAYISGELSQISEGFLESFHLQYIPVLPALVGLRAEGKGYGKWSGVRVNGSVSLILNDIPMRTETGDIQLTDYGISGIPVFQLSRYAVRAISEGSSAKVCLDFLPTLTKDFLKSYLVEHKRTCPYKTLKEQFIGMLPLKLIDVIINENDEEEEVIDRLKNFTLVIKGAHTIKQAQVCSGGVSLDNLDENLQARNADGLYFAGECLDVDGSCGGYNLQWAWSSGHLAGMQASKSAETHK